MPVDTIVSLETATMLHDELMKQAPEIASFLRWFYVALDLVDATSDNNKLLVSESARGIYPLLFADLVKEHSEDLWKWMVLAFFNTFCQLVQDGQLPGCRYTLYQIAKREDENDCYQIVTLTNTNYHNNPRDTVPESISFFVGSDLFPMWIDNIPRVSKVYGIKRVDTYFCSWEGERLHRYYDYTNGSNNRGK